MLRLQIMSNLKEASPNADLNEYRHDCQPDSAARDEDDLDSRPLSLKVLTEHQSGRISRQPDADS
jgi:hypothetical protein